VLQVEKNLKLTEQLNASVIHQLLRVEVTSRGRRWFL